MRQGRKQETLINLSDGKCPLPGLHFNTNYNWCLKTSAQNYEVDKPDFVLQQDLSLPPETVLITMPSLTDLAVTLIQGTVLLRRVFEYSIKRNHRLLNFISPVPYKGSTWWCVHYTFVKCMESMWSPLCCGILTLRLNTSEDTKGARRGTEHLWWEQMWEGSLVGSKGPSP